MPEPAAPRLDPGGARHRRDPGQQFPLYRHMPRPPPRSRRRAPSSPPSARPCPMPAIMSMPIASAMARPRPRARATRASRRARRAARCWPWCAAAAWAILSWSSRAISAAPARHGRPGARLWRRGQSRAGHLPHAEKIDYARAGDHVPYAAYELSPPPDCRPRRHPDR